jgi:hypothetical protein
MTLVPSDYLTRARDWLATAVEKTGPVEIAAAKAEIATAAEATKQLGLSKEIQDDAKEMVRRAEYALDKARRRGQAEGAIRTAASNLIPGNRYGQGARTPSSDLPSPREFFNSEDEYKEARAMGELEPAEFDDVIDAARTEGNLSRANVTRLAREKSNSSRTAPNRRALPDVARDLGIDLRRLTERFERFAADDRFGRNKNEVAAHLRHHLAHALKVLTDLEQEINSNPKDTQ